MALFGNRKKKNPFDAWISPRGKWDASETPDGGGTSPGTMSGKQSWFDGGKFRAKDGLALALGAIGDGLAMNNGGQAIAAPMLMDRLTNARKQQQQQAEESRIRAAMRSQGLGDDQIDLVLGGAAKMGDFREQGPEWAYEQDNAGNVWRYDKRTGKFDAAPVFVDRAERQSVIDGQIVRVPNPFSAQQQAGPRPGEVIDGFRFKGGNPNDQGSWEPVASAQQQTFTREQYQGLVNVFGPDGAQAYLKRNGMTVGGY